MYLVKVAYAGYSNEFVVNTKNPVTAVQVVMKKYLKETNGLISSSPRLKLRCFDAV